MNKRFGRVIVVILTLSIVAAACASGETPTVEEPRPAATSPPETQPTEAPTESEQEVVLYTTSGEGDMIDCLNPAYCWVGYQLWEVLYDTLADYGSWGVDWSTPRLAESWDISDDGYTWTFHLRDLSGATFHDGTPLTAESVAWSLNYIGGNEAISWLLGTWAGENFGATVIDDRTVQLTLDEPMAEEIFLDSLPYAYILPRHIWEQYDAETIYDFDNAEAIGSGPYKLVEWIPGQHIVLEAHEGHFKGKPPVDRIVVITYSNLDAATQSLISGEVDSITYVGPDMVDPLMAIPEITVIENPPEMEYHMWFNVMEDSDRHPALGDVRVRQAIAHAIDKQQLVDLVLYGRAYATNNMFDGGPNYSRWAPADVKSYAFDLDEGNRILEEAGYLDDDGDGVREMNDGSGLPLSIRLNFDADNSYLLVYAETISTWLAGIGIEAKPSAMDTGTLNDTMRAFDYDIAVTQYAFTFDPDLQMQWFLCDAIDWGINFAGYCSDEMEELYVAQRYEPDFDKRLEYIHDMLRLVHDDVPYIQLALLKRFEAFRNDRWSISDTDNGWMTWSWDGIWGYEQVGD
jgi:peptide/nickel transport system substrate-binding protein